MPGETDVPASIAGYYYQILIACRELIYYASLKDGINYKVGIEKGSDIRIFYENPKENSICIEAKFYKDKYFTKNHYAIRHTLYNFYRHFKESGIENIYRFCTNVDVSNDDKTFFEQWPQNDKDESLQYKRGCKKSCV